MPFSQLLKSQWIKKKIEEKKKRRVANKKRDEKDMLLSQALKAFLLSLSCHARLAFLFTILSRYFSIIQKREKQNYILQI